MRIAVIGSGPVGLYAAFRLVSAGHEVDVFEQGAEVAANVKAWGFVRLFSAMELNLPADARAALEAAGHAPPAADAYPTGEEFRARALVPLAAWLSASGRCRVHTLRRVAEYPDDLHG